MALTAPPPACHHPSEGDGGQTAFPLSSCFLELPSPSWRLPAPSVKNRELAVVSCRWYWRPAQSLPPMRCLKTAFPSCLVLGECWVVFPLFEASTLQISPPPPAFLGKAAEMLWIQGFCNLLVAQLDPILLASPPEWRSQ